MGVITPIVAALSFVLSLINSIILFKDKMRHFSVLFDDFYVTDYCITHHDGKFNVVKVKYIFSNKSQLPISITRIRMIIDDLYVDVDILPHVVEHSAYNVGKEKISQNVLESTVLPIQISGLGANSGFLAFQIPNGLLTGDETTLKFQIFTTRGKSIEKEFKLHEEIDFRTDWSI